MEKIQSLQIQLPSGSWRYVTSLDNEDIAYSLYDIRALKSTQSNIERAENIAAKHALSDQINFK